MKRFAPVLALALALGLGMLLTTARAHAEPVSGTDTHASACRGLQNEANALLDEYKNPKTTEDRKAAILNRLRVIGGDWKDIGCQGRFGNIVRQGRPGLTPTVRPGVAQP